MKKLIFLFLLFLLSMNVVYATSISKKYTIEECKKGFSSNESIEYCYSSVAFDENNLEICNLIENSSINSYCKGIVSKNPSHCENAGISRSNCYFQIAPSVKDSSLCYKLNFSDNNEAYIKQCLSAVERKVKILPERASEIARERLGELGFNITLKEVGKNISIYEARAVKEVKIFGLFKKKAEIIAEIDAETGEVKRIRKPWWAFLASGL